MIAYSVQDFRLLPYIVQDAFYILMLWANVTASRLFVGICKK